MGKGGGDPGDHGKNKEEAIEITSNLDSQPSSANKKGKAYTGYGFKEVPQKKFWALFWLGPQ